MTEKEKMLAGELYDCGDAELLGIWNNAKNRMREYNMLDYADRDSQMRILDALLGSRGQNTQITAPFYVDYGKFIHLGNNCEVNMNCVFLDCNTITLGDHALIGPGVHIYTAFHPLRAPERFHTPSAVAGGFAFAVTQSLPVTLGDNVWIGGGSILMPGVTVGSNTVVGAGSIVTKSLPENALAYGNPCRVIKSL